MKKKLGSTVIIMTVVCIAVIALMGLREPPATADALMERISGRDYPSVFQAWNPVDMPEYALSAAMDRLKAAAMHDLIWEEPISQLSFGTELVLGAEWDHTYHGLAVQFTPESQAQALKNRRIMLEMNPNMVFLMEIRWRDAPGSFLPEDSPVWLRNEDGTRAEGWDGGPEPYYLMDRDSEALLESVFKQAHIAVETGIYDGIMLDWAGHLPVVKRVREAIGPEGILIVNIHDDIERGAQYKEYINGAFMELNIYDESAVTERNARDWDDVREALLYFETELLEPQINCLENWGDRADLKRMRATTTLGLTHSDGYVLYGDPNPLPTPDHLHDWYDFWNVPLGQPASRLITREDGAYQREFEGGTVVYNHHGNGEVTVAFETERKRVSDGTVNRWFRLEDTDGDIFVRL